MSKPWNHMTGEAASVTGPSGKLLNSKFPERGPTKTRRKRKSALHRGGAAGCDRKCHREMWVLCDMGKSLNLSGPQFPSCAKWGDWTRPSSGPLPSLKACAAILPYPSVTVNSGRLLTLQLQGRTRIKQDSREKEHLIIKAAWCQCLLHDALWELFFLKFLDLSTGNLGF